MTQLTLVFFYINQSSVFCCNLLVNKIWICFLSTESTQEYKVLVKLALCIDQTKKQKKTDPRDESFGDLFQVVKVAITT